MDHWKDVSALALSGDKLAICTDGVIYLHILSQGTTEKLTGFLYLQMLRMCRLFSAMI